MLRHLDFCGISVKYPSRPDVFSGLATTCSGEFNSPEHVPVVHFCEKWRFTHMLRRSGIAQTPWRSPTHVPVRRLPEHVPFFVVGPEHGDPDGDAS